MTAEISSIWQKLEALALMQKKNRTSLVADILKDWLAIYETTHGPILKEGERPRGRIN